MPEGAPGPRPALHHTVNGGGHPHPRHVWVNVTGITDDRHPGVLLDWRRTSTGTWEALVMWASGGGRSSAHGRTDWLEASHLTPRD